MQFEFFLKNFKKSQVKSFMKLITHLKNIERDLISTVRTHPASPLCTLFVPSSDEQYSKNHY